MPRMGGQLSKGSNERKHTRKNENTEHIGVSDEGNEDISMSVIQTFMEKAPLDLIFYVLIFSDQLRLVLSSALIGSALSCARGINESKCINSESNNVMKVGLRIRSITNLVMIPQNVENNNNNHTAESRNRNVALSLKPPAYKIAVAAVCKRWNDSVKEIKSKSYSGDFTKGIWFTSQFLSQQHDNESLCFSDEQVSILNDENVRLLDFRLASKSIKNRHLVLCGKRFCAKPENLIGTLDFSGCSLVSNDGLDVLLRSAPHLRKLTLADCSRLTSSILSSIWNPGMLELLNISYCTGMDDDALCIIAKQFINLKTLNLSGLRHACVHGGLLHVAKACCKLEHLILRNLGALMSDNTLLSFVENSKKLKTVDVSYSSKISDDGLLSLFTLEKLQVFIAESCPLITTNGVVNSMGSKDMQHLNFRGCRQVDSHIIQRNIPNSWMPVQRESRSRNRRRRREFYF